MQDGGEGDKDQLVLSDEDDGGMDHGREGISENGSVTPSGERCGQGRPCREDLPRPETADLSDAEKKSALEGWKRTNSLVYLSSVIQPKSEQFGPTKRMKSRVYIHCVLSMRSATLRMVELRLLYQLDVALIPRVRSCRP